MSANYPVPDTRFEQTFRRALTREAEKQRATQWHKMGVDPAMISELQKVQPPQISKIVVCKVVVRDIVLMPLVQGLLWTGILIAVKPWLKNVVSHGRKLGSSIYRLVLGTDLVRPGKRV